MARDIYHRGAWLPRSDQSYDDDLPDENALIGWCKENVEDLSKLQVLTPTTDRPDPASIVSTFASVTGAQMVSVKSRGLTSRHGPVVAAWPHEHMLQTAVRHAHNQVLIAIEGSFDLTGWATAVGAFNARTRQTTQPLNDALIDEFFGLKLYFGDVFGGASRGPEARQIQSHLEPMKAADLDEDFVITYCMALGLTDTQAKHLRKHYQRA